MSRFALLLATVVAVPAAVQAQTTPRCTPGRAMILLDRSSSMRTEYIGTKTKWQIATTAVEQVLQTYQARAEFGLMMFPSVTHSCSGSTLFVTPEMNAATDVTNALNGPRVYDAWTPLGEALRDAALQPSINVTDRKNYVILLTDGSESCPSGQTGMDDPTTVEQVRQLMRQGISTYVVGFGHPTSGDGVNAYVLNQMAVAGGTARQGCDPVSADPSSPNNCYYQADNDAALIAALDDIATNITTEVCDGIDNNCDGRIDEGLVQDCSNACGHGTQQCVNGGWTVCNAPQPQPEVCDGIDNDCDGVVDEGCDCQDGQTRTCGSHVGECKPGTQTCQNGKWGTCQGATGPSGETCDGKDNDCDGVIDPGCQCITGTTRECGGPNVGQCHTGTQVCKIDGTWGDCDGAQGPTPEVCDGIDNDCDGLVDEPGKTEGDDVPHDLCGGTATCQNGVCVGNPPPASPQPVADLAGQGAGCGCQAGGAQKAPVGGAALGLTLLALLLVRRRRS